MKIKTHIINNKKIAELISEDVLINTAEEGMALLGDLYYQEFDIIIV